MKLEEAIRILRRRAQCEREAIQTDQKLLEALERVIRFVDNEPGMKRYDILD